MAGSTVRLNNGSRTATADPETSPYVGPRPFERSDEARFFGRDREASDLASRIIAHSEVVLYAQSGAGKTSLVNAKMIPLLEQRGFEVLPPARVYRPSPGIEPQQIGNIYVFHALLSWLPAEHDPKQFMRVSLNSYLKRQPHLSDEDGSPRPRLIVFDQFEELFTAYPERWKERKGFFIQVRDALDGAPLLLRDHDILSARRLLHRLQKPQDPISEALVQHFSADLKSRLERYDDSSPHPDGLTATLVLELNRIIESKELSNERGMGEGLLTEEIGALAAERPKGERLIHLNRLLLHQAYPDEVAERSEGDPLLRALFVMREEYIAELDPYAATLPEMLRTRFRLERLRAEAARAAISGPLEKTQRRFASGVAEALVRDLMEVPEPTDERSTKNVGEEFVEPVQLQVVCQRLWEMLKPEDTEITFSDLRAVGDVNQALSDFYEHCIQKASGEPAAKQTGVSEGALRRWFDEHLITPRGTRSAVIQGPVDTGGIPNAVVAMLAELHLIQSEWRGEMCWYELAHDRFIRPIQDSNQRWLTKRAGAAQVRLRLEAKAADWVRRDRSNAGLLSPAELHEAERWLNSPEAAELSYSEKLLALVQASRAAVKSRQVRGLVGWLGALAAALVVALYTTWLAMERGTISHYRQLSARSELMSHQQSNLLQSSAALAIECVTQLERRKIMPFAAYQALRSGLQLLPRPIALLAQPTENSELKTCAFGADLHSVAIVEAGPSGEVSLWVRRMADGRSVPMRVPRPDTVKFVAFSGDQKRLIVIKVDHGVRVDQCDLMTGGLTGKELKLESSDCLNIGPGGRYLALTGSDHTLEVREALTGRRIGPPLQVGERVSGAFLSQDGRYLAISIAARRGLSQKNTFPIVPPKAQVWDVAAGRRIAQTSLRAQVSTATFSEDDRYLAAATGDASAQVWQVPHGGDVGRLTKAFEGALKYEGTVRCMAFSRDRKYLATASSGCTAQVWELRSGQERARMIHTTGMRAVAFSSDGTRVATASEDGAVRVWESTSKYLGQQSYVSPARVRTVAFSPDGRYWVTGGEDFTVRVWDHGRMLPALNCQGIVRSVAFSPDGKHLAAAGDEGLVQTWEVATWRPAPPNQSDHLPVGIRAIAFSSDSSSLAAGCADGNTWMWAVVSGRQIGGPLRHGKAVNAVAFSPDGRHLATGSDDRTARVWNITSGREQWRVRHKGGVNGVAFSPDGRYLATASDDFQAQVWEAATGAPSGLPMKHYDMVNAVVFSPDGRYLATASDDGTARVWEADSKREIARLDFDDMVNAAAFSPDGEYLATASGTTAQVELWQAQDLIDQIRSRLTLAPAELSRYRD